MKKTALLLFDLFSNYEISVALSVLSQGGRKYDVFCLNEEAVSEEGLCVRRTKALSELRIADYDSLLLPGCMDPREIMDDERILGFIRNFNLSEHIIASISSSPLLLMKAG
ncbi:MAG: DJ-1/PfpI family protein, partial [Oscillospiraceae bacterium]|nr:DJ-1/PfpI family protein [Oscillospiraceae bacterium]